MLSERIVLLVFILGIFMQWYNSWSQRVWRSNSVDRWSTTEHQRLPLQGGNRQRRELQSTWLLIPFTIVILFVNVAVRLLKYFMSLPFSYRCFNWIKRCFAPWLRWSLRVKQREYLQTLGSGHFFSSCNQAGALARKFVDTSSACISMFPMIEQQICAVLQDAWISVLKSAHNHPTDLFHILRRHFGFIGSQICLLPPVFGAKLGFNLFYVNGFSCTNNPILVTRCQGLQVFIALYWSKMEIGCRFSFYRIVWPLILPLKPSLLFSYKFSS